MNREAIHKHIDDHLDEHIAHIQRWVQQPSVSWDNLGVDECADVVAQSYQDLGCAEVEKIPGRFHPGVWAFYDAGSPVTVHSYCMFDTRTVRESEWSHDPWGAELVRQEPYPKVLIGRGAMGAKGPYVAFLNALASIIAVEGTLPVNVMFLAEGDEIMGSPSYREFVSRYDRRLRDVCASYCVTSTQSPDGSVAVGLGLKGMVVIELTATGAKWGRSVASTIHSSGASLVDSPPFRLAQALASLTDDEGRGCKVKGLEELWAYRKPLTDAEQALLEGLRQRLEGQDWRDMLPVGGRENVDELIGGTEGLDPLVTFLYGPSLNVAGLRSGFLGPETGTIPFIVPGSATAMLDMRLVVDLPSDEIIACVRRHLDNHGFSDIDINVYASFDHSLTSPTDPALQPLFATLNDWGVDTVIWPIQAGGGPWTVVPNRFGVPCIRGGAIGGGGGSVDEYLVIEGDGKVAGLADTEKYHVDLLYAFARSNGYSG